MYSESNNNQEKTYLRIADVFKEDVGRGIIRIDPMMMNKLKLEMGDIIEVYNEHKDMRTVGQVFPSDPKDIDTNIIRLDNTLRKNLAAHIDSRVVIKKIEDKLAKTLTLAFVGKSVSIKNSKGLLKKLENRVVTKGDLINSYLMGERIYFKVLEFTPAVKGVRIHSKTKIKISGKNI